MAKYNNRFIAVDTETGGLLSKGKVAVAQVALTEVAMVSVDNESLEIVEQDSWLIAPYMEGLEYTAKAAEVSGITKQMCEKEGLDLEFVYKSMVKYLKANNVGTKKPIIIMQNKKFDIPFVENLFDAFKDSFYKHIERIEDTMEWSRNYMWPSEGKHNLAIITDRCGLDHTDAHRALADTIVTAKVWIHFMKKLRGENIQPVVSEENTNSFRKTFKF